MRTLSLMTVLLAGCDLTDKDTTPDTADTTDTGDTAGLSFEARIQTYCLDTDCGEVGLYGGASGSDVVSYAWTARGNPLASTTEDAEVTVLEPGEIVDVTLTVTDSIGATSTAMVHVSRLSFGTSETGPVFDPTQATITFPGDLPCGAPIGIASIGGCVRFSDFLAYNAKDFGSTSFRGDTLVYESGAGNILPVSSNSFIDTAAWYKDTVHAGVVQFHNMGPADYDVSGGIYRPIALDPAVLSATGSQARPEDHFTFWFTPIKVGTEVFASHIDVSTGAPIFHDFRLTAVCDGNGYNFSMDPVEPTELDFTPVITPGG